MRAEPGRRSGRQKEQANEDDQRHWQPLDDPGRSNSAVDLTFASVAAASPPSECQIQTRTIILYLLVSLRFRQSQTNPPRQGTNVRTGTLAEGGEITAFPCLVD